MKFHHVLALLIANLLTDFCFAEPEFRLGISGQPSGNNGGFVIQSLDTSSPLLTLRESTGDITRAEAGDRILTLDQQLFSPAKLQAMSKSLAAKNGLVDLVLIDSKTNNQVKVSAVLRRTDMGADFGQRFQKIARDEYAGVKGSEVQISERPASIVCLNLDSAFTSRYPSEKDSALSRLAACQAGIDRLRVTAKEKHFEKMLSAGSYARAERIVQNAVAGASLQPFGQESVRIADQAQKAVIDEFRSSLESYARSEGKKLLQEKTYGHGFFRFDPVTQPPNMSVEVIPGADVRIILLGDKQKTASDVDQLPGWTPLPATNASIFGRYFYRVRNPNDGKLLFGYHQDKYKVIISKPANGQILFP